MKSKVVPLAVICFIALILCLLPFADFMMRAVEIADPGKHYVEFKY